MMLTNELNDNKLYCSSTGRFTGTKVGILFQFLNVFT